MELVTAEELARQYKVTVPAIRQWTRQGMPHHKLGRCTRFDPPAILEWFRQREGGSSQHKSQHGHG